MPVFKIQHITKYLYDRPVKESVNQIKIFPFNRNGQEILSHELHITDEPIINKFQDYWGNSVGYFTLSQPHESLIIESRMIAKTFYKEIDESLSIKEDRDLLRQEISSSLLLLDLAQKETIQSQDKIQSILNDICIEECSPLQSIKSCSEYIFENFQYLKGITDIETTVDEIMELRSGVCQDFAHVLLQLLRTIGIPSRYVSGYVCPNKNGMRGEGATHAWVEAYIPNLGWIGIDPTNNCFANEHHIQLAVGRDFTDCTPVKGTFKGPANHELMVFVSVGYEDGTVFEDENAVKMHKELTDAVPVIHIVQQQQ
ncbi:MAG: transglutaminase family protein [Sphingobacteriales bacterium]|nr:transglutaminase family protein [Sphingobacteriales bacterium]